MWHTDWHVMKDTRMKGLNLITYLDDASRCVTGFTLFREATSKNAVTALRQAIAKFGVPSTILSDNGSCFVGRVVAERSMPVLGSNEVWRYACLDDYIEYYNTDRLHWALDIDNYEIPLMKFHKKGNY